MNIPMNTTPSTRQKIIHQVFHLSGAFSASLSLVPVTIFPNPSTKSTPTRKKILAQNERNDKGQGQGQVTYVNPKQNSTSPEVTRKPPAQSILSLGPNLTLSFGISKKAPIVTIAS